MGATDLDRSRCSARAVSAHGNMVGLEVERFGLEALTAQAPRMNPPTSHAAMRVLRTRHCMPPCWGGLSVECQIAIDAVGRNGLDAAATRASQKATNTGGTKGRC